MLISHKYKFIMTRTAKTASTSTLGYFQQFCVPEDKIIKPIQEFTPEIISDVGIVGPRGEGNIENTLWKPHITALELKNILRNTQNVFPDTWERYFKFCNIRNPYDKAMSMYFDQKFRKNIVVGELDLERIEFEQWLPNNYVSDSYAYTINGEFCLDDTIRYENLLIDLERICNKLEVPWVATDFPTFKMGRRPANITVKDLYTEKAKTYIQTVCALELDLFKYDFSV